MGLSLFRAFLVINVFSIGTENPVTTKPYRFPVYPVNECPRSKDEFKTAAQRRNCSKGLRYLCAPNKYLSSLIEFCTDRQIGLYQEGNCVILEGTGDLDHYSCVEKFNSSCPLEFYNDEEIYKYPACLEINKELRCFAADNDCKKRELNTTKSNPNISKPETVGDETFRGATRGWLAIGYIIATAAVLAVIILSWIIFQKRKRGTDWVDPEDPTVIAESEILSAAKSIEGAAQKLSQLKPRKKAKEADMSLNFEEQILEAAKSIASATAALVKSASAAQRELVAQGKVRTRKEIGATYHKSQILDKDGQWSEGLISAAKKVAAATHSLCESANAMVQGHATEERLIASAKEVAGSTAHLLVACRVKADKDSVAMKRVQAAGNAVKRATEVLVKAAQQAKQRDEDEDINVAVDSRKVGGIKQELQIQEEMLWKEREWIEAREKLAKFRKQRYKDMGHDSDSSSAF